MHFTFFISNTFVNVSSTKSIISVLQLFQHYINWNNVNQSSVFIFRNDTIISNHFHSIDVISEFSLSKTFRRNVKFQSSSKSNEFKLFWFTIENTLRDEFLSNYFNLNFNVNDNNSSINLFVNRNKKFIIQSSSNIFLSTQCLSIDEISNSQNSNETFCKY